MYTAASHPASPGAWLGSVPMVRKVLPAFLPPSSSELRDRTAPGNLFVCSSGLETEDSDSPGECGCQWSPWDSSPWWNCYSVFQSSCQMCVNTQGPFSSRVQSIASPPENTDSGLCILQKALRIPEGAATVWEALLFEDFLNLCGYHLKRSGHAFAKYCFYNLSPTAFLLSSEN